MCKYTLQSSDDLELFLPRLSSEEKFSRHLNASAHLLLSGVCIAQFIFWYGIKQSSENLSIF